MSDSAEKGDALERATRAIEEMVIRAQPGIAQAPFSIQPRAHLKKGDQAFEIDLLVRINEKSPYETQHFFECKNWKDPVDRNVVTIFARKMTALGAARGTIIGRKFTSEAVLEAKQTPNLELVAFTDDVWSPFRAPSVKFRTDAHIFPTFIGNRYVLSYHECDDCNHYFGETADDSLGKFLGLGGVAGRVRSRAGTRTFVSGDKKLAGTCEGPSAISHICR